MSLLGRGWTADAARVEAMVERRCRWLWAGRCAAWSALQIPMALRWADAPQVARADVAALAADQLIAEGRLRLGRGNRLEVRT